MNRMTFKGRGGKETVKTLLGVKTHLLAAKINESTARKMSCLHATKSITFLLQGGHSAV